MRGLDKCPGIYLGTKRSSGFAIKFEMASGPDPKNLERLREETQSGLLSFLKADLELAFTFLETAALSPRLAVESVEKARRALEVVRHMEGRILDPKMWWEIHERADQLETAIQEFST